MGHGQPASCPDCMYVGRYHATALNVLAPPYVTYRKAGRLFCGFHTPITPPWNISDVLNDTRQSIGGCDCPPVRLSDWASRRDPARRTGTAQRSIPREGTETHTPGIWGALILLLIQRAEGSCFFFLLLLMKWGRRPGRLSLFQQAPRGPRSFVLS